MPLATAIRDRLKPACRRLAHRLSIASRSPYVHIGIVAVTLVVCASMLLTPCMIQNSKGSAYQATRVALMSVGELLVPASKAWASLDLYEKETEESLARLGRTEIPPAGIWDRLSHCAGRLLSAKDHSPGLQGDGKEATRQALREFERILKEQQDTLERIG